MSEWKVEVVRITNLQKHPGADRLSIVNVHGDANGGGYPVIVANDVGHKVGDLAIYIPVDSLVPASDPRFSFLVPEPVRKDEMTDAQWAARQERYQKDLAGTARIKARKLRGVFSMGLIIPLELSSNGMLNMLTASKDDGTGLATGSVMHVNEGDHVAMWLNITKYEVDEANVKGHASGAGGPSGDTESDPGFVPVYTDVEGIRRWGDVLVEGEEVVVTEKIHGQNSRFVYSNGRLWVGSHYKFKKKPRRVTLEELSAYAEDHGKFQQKERFWRLTSWMNPLFKLFGWDRVAPEAPRAPRDVPASNWWTVALEMGLEERLVSHQDLVIYGEVYGACQDLKYGSHDGLKFRAFDALDLNTRTYLDYDQFAYIMGLLDIETAPVLYRGPWSESVKDLAEGKTTLTTGAAAHVREGIVIRPVKERHHPRLGRVVLKLVSQAYLLR